MTIVFCYFKLKFDFFSIFFLCMYSENQNIKNEKGAVTILSVNQDEAVAGSIPTDGRFCD